MKNPNPRRRLALSTTLALLLALPCVHAAAQSGKPLRIIVPNAAGSSVDALTRSIGTPLSRALGQPVIIENLPGAGGITGTVQLVRAPKDGSTIAMVSNNHVVNPSIYKSLPYDTLMDITPISVIGGSPFVLVVHPSVSAKDVKELTALAKSRPGELNYGSSGNGTILHLAAEAFKSEAGGLGIKHIPYKGTNQLTTDLLGGQIQMAVLGVTGVAPHIKAGRLRAIGVTTKARSPLLPDVPTIAEQGLPRYDMEGWIAMIAPAGVSPAVVSKLYADAQGVLSNKEVRDSLAAQGMTPLGTTPEATARLFKAEMERYARIVKESGATAE
ncbi:MAG: tripartite tricarboxylate transporter substrate binding protein [Noviherbaspirillum sp.]